MTQQNEKAAKPGIIPMVSKKKNGSRACQTIKANKRKIHGCYSNAVQKQNNIVDDYMIFQNRSVLRGQVGAQRSGNYVSPKVRARRQVLENCLSLKDTRDEKYFRPLCEYRKLSTAVTKTEYHCRRLPDLPNSL